MRGGVLTRGRFLALSTALVVLVAVAGCGGSDSDSGVDVQTGSLSKAQFVKKADAVCKAARTEFVSKYVRFSETHQAQAANASAAQQEALLGEAVESVVAPSVEDEIAQISKLGAPDDYAPEVEDFLTALQQRVEKGQEDPAGMTATPFPFKRAEDLAKKAGMQGCAESFS